MTGYGKGARRLKDGSIILVEIRTVNSKFFEIVARTPEALSTLEERIKAALHNKIKRGRANVCVVYKKLNDTDKDNLSLDMKLAKRYYELLINLKKTFNLKDNLGLSHLIAIPNLMAYKEKEIHLEEIWPVLKEALGEALIGLVRMREAEGRTIRRDLIYHLNTIERLISQIKKRYPMMLKHLRLEIRRRVKDYKLEQFRQPNEERLEQEIVLLADNLDISEELSRTQGHIGLFHNTLEAGGEAGKKMDFIAQEMHREVNTIGSKSRDFAISKKVIGLKVALEKMREQLQNVE